MGIPRWGTFLMLHITNGDIAADLLRRSDLGGDVLPWRDVLHEGPVPGGLDLDRLAGVRARYLAGRGWGDAAELRRAFQQRNDRLRRWAEDDLVALWFEHDLFDQLQLLEILTWFAGQTGTADRLFLIEIGDFPGIDKFVGIGQLTPAQIASRFDFRRPVGAVEFETASEAWRAFGSADPRGLEAILSKDLFHLPFLADAVLRHLQEFPSVENGLSRTEQEILAAVRQGARTPSALFRAVQEKEERPFMGDWSFWGHVNRLAGGPASLLVGGAGVYEPAPSRNAPERYLRQPLALSNAGRRVLDDDADAGLLIDNDRWLGGVHLHGPAPRWRWSRTERRLTGPHFVDTN